MPSCARALRGEPGPQRGPTTTAGPSVPNQRPLPVAATVPGTLVGGAAQDDASLEVGRVVSVACGAMAGRVDSHDDAGSLVDSDDEGSASSLEGFALDEGLDHATGRWNAVPPTFFFLCVCVVLPCCMRFRPTCVYFCVLS